MSVQTSQNKQNMEKFRNQLELCCLELETIPKKVVSQMADVGIAVTKMKTPVNKDPKVIGGTLRKAWTKTKVHKVGNCYISGYTNNTSYAMFVNNGHRIVNATGETIGYVPPQKMLEKGMTEARQQTEILFRGEVAKVKRKSGF